MKIVVLGIRGFPNVEGGPETHCENLYTRLAAMCLEVIVLARKTYVDPQMGSYKGVRLIALPCLRNKFLEAFLHTLLGVFVARRIQPDILHIHAIGPSLFTPLARILGLKVVMTNHGSDYNRKKWGRFAKFVLRLGERLGTRCANGVICISELIANLIRERYKKEVVVIPNGVNIPQILESDDFIKRYGLEKKKYIMSIGRFVPEKGFHDLIDAFIRFKAHDSQSRYKSWKLVIAGEALHEDRYTLYLKKKAKSSNGVILPGFVTGKELQELYSQARLFVLASYYEGLSIVLLEAMSYGLECLATDIPANRAVSLPCENYFRAEDIEELAQKLKEFVNRPFTEEEKSRQIDMLRKNYNWDDIARKTLAVYKEVSESR